MKTNTVLGMFGFLFLAAIGISAAAWRARAADPAPAALSQTLRYNFETGPVEWLAQNYPDSQACSEVALSEAQAREGRHSLKLSMDLIGGDAHKNSGEAVVMLNQTNVAAGNFAGRTITLWVYAPQGSLGSPGSPNGFQLFTKDDHWRSLYGTLTPVTEGQWARLSLRVDSTKPENGWLDDGFDPHQIIAVGLKMVAGSGSPSTYTGPVYLDAVKW